MRLFSALLCSLAFGCQTSTTSGSFKATISNSSASPALPATWTSNDTMQVELPNSPPQWVCLLAIDPKSPNPSGNGLLIVLPTQPDAGQSLTLPSDAYVNGAPDYISFTPAIGNVFWVSKGGTVQVNKIDPWQVTLSGIQFEPPGATDPTMGTFTLDGTGTFARNPSYNPNAASDAGP